MCLDSQLDDEFLVDADISLTTMVSKDTIVKEVMH